MSTWTEEQLRDAVSKKGNLKATTDIICKFFLDAVSEYCIILRVGADPVLSGKLTLVLAIEQVESQKYGWFW